MRDSIVVYRSHFEAVFGECDEDEQIFTSEQKAEFMEKYLRYAFYGIEPNFTGVMKRIFATMRPQIDANNHRFVSGKKGGRPKKTTCKNIGFEDKIPVEEKPKTTGFENEEPPQKSTITSGFEETKPNVNVNENVNVNDTADAVSARVRANHGLHGNVILDDYAYEQLRQEIGESALKDYVNRLDGYIEKHPKFAGDHGSTIVRWYNEDEVKRKAEGVKTAQTESRPNYSADELNALFEGITAEDM